MFIRTIFSIVALVIAVHVQRRKTGENETQLYCLWCFFFVLALLLRSVLTPNLHVPGTRKSALTAAAATVAAATSAVTQNEGNSNPAP